MSAPRGELAPAVAELLAEAVDSFEKLELVLALHARVREATAAELATAISVPGDLALDALRDLERAKVTLTTAAGWMLDPAGPWVAHVKLLVRAAEEDRTELFRFLSKRAMDRVRAEAARVFADAFVLRPKKKGGSDA